MNAATPDNSAMLIEIVYINEQILAPKGHKHEHGACRL